MTISQSFQELLRRVQTGPAFDAAAVRHVGEIKTRLDKAYNLRKFLTVGSYARGTLINRHSDVDCFAVVSRDDARWGGSYMASGSVLESLRAELQARYPFTTVRRDAQAVVVEFSDCSVDVVPAVFERMGPNNWPVYRMPDGNGGWMESAPELHNTYLKEENDRTISKLRGTAQLLKFWRECRTPRVPLSSFHIEIALAAQNTCRGVKSYAECVTEVLQLLADRECRAIRDPMGVAGTIGAVPTERQRTDSLAAIRYSRDHAKAALQAEAFGDVHESRRQWDIVFNGSFPW